MKTIAGPGFTGTVYAEGGTVFELAAGGRPLLRLGRTRCGGFAEDGALLKKLRFHASLDSLSASIDTASVIPFGCEYLVSRELEMVAGLALWTVDVSAVARGIVSAVELEPVTFPGPWRTLEYLIYGEKEFRRVEPGETETEFYRGRELVMSVRLTAADGARVEFNAGGDLWRHRAAMHLPEAVGEYALSGGAELDCADVALPESGRRVRCGGEAESRPCLTSPAARRIFRDFVRRSAADLRIGGLAPGCCCAAAHLERPGKKELEHLDLDDCISFYLWGNRQLAKNGHHLRITPAAEGPFAGSVSAANLGEYPRLPLEEQ